MKRSPVKAAKPSLHIKIDIKYSFTTDEATVCCHENTRPRLGCGQADEPTRTMARTRGVHLSRRSARRRMNRLAADGFVLLGGPLSDTDDFLLIVDAADANEINATLARDPWTQSGMLEVKDIQPWTILLEATKEA